MPSIEMLKSKIHSGTITDADVNYEGSITISKELVNAVGIMEYEKVLVVDVTNGARFETYVIVTNEEGQIIVNGAAAKLVSPGDKVIIMAYWFVDLVEDHKIEEFAKKHGYGSYKKPAIIWLDEDNKIKRSEGL